MCEGPVRLKSEIVPKLFLCELVIRGRFARGSSIRVSAGTHHTRAEVHLTFVLTPVSALHKSSTRSQVQQACVVACGEVFCLSVFKQARLTRSRTEAHTRVHHGCRDGFIREGENPCLTCVLAAVRVYVQMRWPRPTVRPVRIRSRATQLSGKKSTQKWLAFAGDEVCKQRGHTRDH